VSAGQPYVVGERQAEVFVPGVSGVILPSVGQIPAALAGIQALQVTQAGNSMASALVKALGNKAASAQAAFSAGMGGGMPVNIPGGLAGWIAMAEALTGVPSVWTDALTRLIMFESGGNPNAINLTDSNARAGHPSQGLMQTIPGTFAAYMLPGHGNILNPVDNIVAGIRYILSRYGDIFHTPGMLSLARGGGYVGYDNGGWLMPGHTMAYNGTGSPERILGPGQGASGGMTVVVPVNIDGREVARTTVHFTHEELLRLQRQTVSLGFK
jgi:hypothetical protein